MEKVSQVSAYRAMVNVYVGNEIVERVTRERARELKEAGTHFFINAGKALRKVKVCEPTSTEIEHKMGWNVARGLQSSVLGRGAATHTGRQDKSRWHRVPHYPVPYAFEGHLKTPRAAVVNASVR